MQLFQKPSVFLVVGLDLNRPFGRIQRGDFLSEVHVRPGAEIVPLSVPFRDRDGGKRVQRLLIHAVSDVVFRGRVFHALGLLLCSLPAVPGIAPGIAVAAERIGVLLILILILGSAAPGVLLLCRTVLDLVIGGVDIVHHLSGVFVPRIQIRVVFFCQVPISLFDFLITGIPGNAQNFIRIRYHVRRPYRCRIFD